MTENGPQSSFIKILFSVELAVEGMMCSVNLYYAIYSVELKWARRLFVNQNDFLPHLRRGPDVFRKFSLFEFDTHDPDLLL